LRSRLEPAEVSARAGAREGDLVVSLQRRSSSSARVLWTHLTRLRVSFAPPTTLSERTVRRSLLLLEPLHRIVCSVSGASRLPLNPCKRSEHSDGLAATSESPHHIRCMPLHFTESYSARSASLDPRYSPTRPHMNTDRPASAPAPNEARREGAEEEAAVHGKNWA
jgi:hypothetical protein